MASRAHFTVLYRRISLAVALTAVGLYLFIIALYFPWKKRCIKSHITCQELSWCSLSRRVLSFLSLCLFVCSLACFAHRFLSYAHLSLKGRNSTRAGVFLPHSFPWRLKQKGACKVFVGEFSQTKTPIYFCGFFQCLRRRELDAYQYYIILLYPLIKQWSIKTLLHPCHLPDRRYCFYTCVHLSIAQYISSLYTG